MCKPKNEQPAVKGKMWGILSSIPNNFAWEKMTPIENIIPLGNT
jgi:hypothetical protein